MKKMRNSLFFKAFYISLTMMLLITMTAYLLLYLFLPSFYRNYKMEEYEEKVQTLIKRLERTTAESEEMSILGDFARNDAANVTIYKADGDIFFQLTESIEMSVVQVAEEGTTGIPFEIVTDTADIAERNCIESEYSYTTNDQVRRMVIEIPLQPLNEAKAVMINIYPLAGLLCVAFSFALSVLVSHAVVKPVRNIQHILREMVQLKPDAHIHTNTRDEIAEMSRDVNGMYQELRSTITALEQKIQDCSAAENEKIDFLRNVSHELKTPLASANALIEGVLYDIPPYCDAPERYLTECRDFLQKAIALTKESLNLSPVYREEPQRVDLKQLIESEFLPYQVILKSRQIRYDIHVPDHVLLTTSRNLFAKALSNVLSNAANYTEPGGAVRIICEKDYLCIENTCSPLKEVEVQKLMQPMKSGNHGNQQSNGLGLYIVKQSLSLLKIPFAFEPMEDGNGMRFTFDFQKKMERMKLTENEKSGG